MIEGFPSSINYFEKQKAEFQVRLNNIIHSQLTVENIETFADHALNSLIQFTKDVVASYSANVQTEKIGRDLEDAAYEAYGLENIEDLLLTIQQKIEQIKAIVKFIEDKSKITDEIITPPDSTELSVANGEEQFNKRKLIPRLITLLYILENDFEIPKEEVILVQGDVSHRMMRKKPYFRVQINDLNRLVYICDEEGNASYVFDKEILDQNEIQYHDLDLMTKEERNILIAKIPRVGCRLIQTKNWRKNMSCLLREEIVLQKIKEKSLADAQANSSEFLIRERKTYLPFSEFQEQVSSLYSSSNSGNVSVWYQEERKNHSDWPSNPNCHYRDKGWIGWPELVGKKNRLKKEYLEFNDFLDKVRAVYSGEKNVYKWYQEERKNHSNWPSDPNCHYRDSGWIGWPELVGKEKKKKISLEEFKIAVKSLYPGGDIGISVWYQEERKNHSDWPSSPEREYAPNWEGWFKTVGIGNPRPEKFISRYNFRDFQAEVRSLYPGKGNVKGWYKKERKNHSDWPSNPNCYYRDSGWIGWPELVGKIKKVFLPYNDFESEVRKIYLGQVNIQKWYETEYRKHPNWPSNPMQFYKKKGWKSWSVLVGKQS